MTSGCEGLMKRENLNVGFRGEMCLKISKSRFESPLFDTD